MGAFLINLVSFGSFLSGTVFGVLLCLGVILQLLKSNPKDEKNEGNDKIKERTELVAPAPTTIESILKPEEVATLRKLIDFLEDFNAPLKSIGGHLKLIYMQHGSGTKVTTEQMERRAKSIIEMSTVTRMEKELHDSLVHLREHAKVMKGIASFLSDMSKAFASFSKDLSKLAYAAKNNMYKGLKDLNIDTKEDMIINNWWQALHVSLDYMSSDQEYLASQITDELLNFSTQIYDEITVIEKRLGDVM